MVIGVCRITLMVPESHSLKEKRQVLRRIKDRARQTFNLAIAEVGDQDAWQSAQIGFAVVANERGFVESMVDKITKFIEDLGAAKVMDDEKDFITYGDGEMTAEGFSHWEPDEPSPPGFGQAGDPFAAAAGKPDARRRGRGARPKLPVRGARRGGRGGGGSSSGLGGGSSADEPGESS
jgi:hypothetical protein